MMQQWFNPQAFQRVSCNIASRPNTPYFGHPTNIGFVSNPFILPDAPQARQITTLRGSMRIIQFGLKISF